MKNTTDVTVDKEKPQTQDFSYKRPIRLTPRKQAEHEGPLAHIQGMAKLLPDFHLYLAPENDPNRPNEIAYLYNVVGYEFVHPKEVNALNPDGTSMEGDKVRFSYKGINSVLMKLPMQTWLIDLAERGKDETVRQKIENNSPDSNELVTKSTDFKLTDYNYKN